MQIGIILHFEMKKYFCLFYNEIHMSRSIFTNYKNIIRSGE